METKHKEYPIEIGEIVLMENGDKIQCIRSIDPSTDCYVCYFKDTDFRCINKGFFACSINRRSDLQNVLFIKLKEE
jgi:hypothetical protein